MLLVLVQHYFERNCIVKYCFKNSKALFNGLNAY